MPGGRLSARIRNSRGEEVAGSQYDLLQAGEDFTFRFKKPHRDRSGKYTLVFDYDGAVTEKDIMVNFLGIVIKNYFSMFDMFNTYYFRCPVPAPRCGRV